VKPLERQLKYERLGPQEFVPYTFDDISLDNIKTACYRFFSDRLTHADMVCDILASQNDPSCSKLSRLPNFKKIHVRFIKVSATERERPKIFSDSTMSVFSKIKPSGQLHSRRQHSTSTLTPLAYKKKATSLSTARISQSSVNHPRSLSVATMLGLGTVISKILEAPKSVEVSEFSINLMAWKPPVVKKFFIDKSSFARGGFREVFKAKDVDLNQFVVKKLLPETLNVMDQVNEALNGTNETVESQCRKAVQMHMLAKHFAEQLQYNTSKEEVEEFGDAFIYKSAKFGKVLDTNEYIVIENFIPGDFVKYLNNDGVSIEGDDPNLLERIEKAECLAHFSYEKSKGELILLDIQGSGYVLYDLDIATMKLVTDTKNMRFCMGNLARKACDNFISTHTCSRYYGLLNLDSI